MTNNGFSNRINRLFQTVFCVIWLVLLPGILATNLYLDWKGLLVWGTVLGCGLFFVWRFRSFWYEQMEGKMKQLVDRYPLFVIFICFMTAQIALQLLCGYGLAIVPASDRNVIFSQASEIAQSGQWHTSESYNYYFLRYPNNGFLLILEAGYFTLLKALGIHNFLYGNIVLNMLAVDVGIALGIYLTYVKYGKRTAVLFQVLCLLFIPFYTYMPFVYTDTLTLPFLMGILVCYEKLGQYRESDRSRGSVACWLVLMGMLTFVGFQLKPTVAIVTIACVLHLCVTGSVRKAVAAVTIVLAVCISCSILYEHEVDRLDLVDQTDYDKENFPYTHWVMMGLREKGNYSLEDRQYTSSFPTKEEKKQGNIQRIHQRLEEYGPWGLIAHQYIKGVSTWHNGKYDMDVHLPKNPIHSSVLHQIFLPGGDAYFLYSGYCSVYHLILVGLIAASLWEGRKNGDLDTTVAWKLAVFGLLCFLAVWESKSRYVMHFTPVLLLIAVDYVVKNNKARGKNNEVSG